MQQGQNMETQSSIGKLSATRRQEKGKGLARKLRAKGLIPAICYGQKHEAISLVVDPSELRRALDPARGQNTVITLAIEHEGKTEQLTVMLKEYQLDSLTQTLLHADFMLVSLDQIVDVTVPLDLLGKPEGVKLGGTLHQVFRKLPVSCKPGDIPSALQADVSALELNEGIQIKDLTLPDGGRG
jgi:large subunit ribosomal protein L25